VVATVPFNGPSERHGIQSMADGMLIGLASPVTAKPHQSAPRREMGNPLWGVPLGSLSATLERPLFSPSRRPPAVAAVAAPPPPPPPKAEAPEQPQLSLVGTVIGATGSIGVFTDQATKEIVRLGIGERHDGWILHAIDERAATFERDRREVTLALPGRNGIEQQGTTIPALAAVAPQPSASMQAQTVPTVPPPRQPVRPPWMNPPQRAGSRTALQNPPAATWLDGDGQMVSPPPRER
jgi:general secretion pathway protein N